MFADGTHNRHLQDLPGDAVRNMEGTAAMMAPRTICSIHRMYPPWVDIPRDLGECKYHGFARLKPIVQLLPVLCLDCLELIEELYTGIRRDGLVYYHAGRLRRFCLPEKRERRPHSEAPQGPLDFSGDTNNLTGACPLDLHVVLVNGRART